MAAPPRCSAPTRLCLVQGELIPQAKPSASITLLRELSIMSVGYPLIDIALVAATSTQSHLRKVLAR